MKILLLLLFSTIAFAQSHAVSLTWTWAQSTGPAATGFSIYRSTIATGSFSLIGQVPSGTLSYADVSSAIQTSGTVWYYRVTAFNAQGESTPSNTIGPLTIPFALSPPGSLAATVK